METKTSLPANSLSVFETGNLKVKGLQVAKAAAPKPLFIVTPIDDGKYPVFLFFPGCCFPNTSYTQLLQHIASHGFIAIAPGDEAVSSLLQCFCGNEQQVESAAEVVDWLYDGLPTVLPENVTADTTKLAVGGHSRGGKIAFALALGLIPISLKITAIFGVDPVAGSSPTNCPEPNILSYIPRDFNLNIPIAIIGTGLGSESKCLIPPFAPNGTNHAEFFNESKPPVYYFLAKEYGHADMLDDGIVYWCAKLLCNHGKSSKGLMIRGCGGIVVAFLMAKLKGEVQDLDAIGEDSSIAPIKLDPVLFVQV